MQCWLHSSHEVLLSTPSPRPRGKMGSSSSAESCSEVHMQLVPGPAAMTLHDTRRHQPPLLGTASGPASKALPSDLERVKGCLTGALVWCRHCAYSHPLGSPRGA